MTRTPVRGPVPVALAVTLLLTCALVGGCDRNGRPEPRTVLRWDWRELALPAPPGEAGEVALRDAVACGARWYVVGSVRSAAGDTRPAAWTSDDGLRWRSVPITAATDYGRQNILYAVACRPGSAAALGAKSGGAHGNPRVSSWQLGADGALTEQTAAFELFGGPEALNVARIAGGPDGWLIAGNRVGGAAVWTGPDRDGFALHDRAPGLTSDAAGATWATDAVGRDTGWTVVGGLTPPGRVDRDPVVWWSADARSWRRYPLGGGPAHEELHRVVAVGDGLVAAGPAGGTFAAWRGAGGAWNAAGRFGAVQGPGVARVSGLAAVAGAVLASVTDGSVGRLYTTVEAATHWTEVAWPGTASAAVAGGGERWLLVAEDGRAWWARAPGA